MKNDISKIPKGHYCYTYDAKTDECNHCPYLGFETINTDVKPIKLWHCSFLNQSDCHCSDEDFELLKSHFGMSDEELWEKFPLDLLWDACKECGENI